MKDNELTHDDYHYNFQERISIMLESGVTWEEAEKQAITEKLESTPIDICTDFSKHPSIACCIARAKKNLN